MNTESGNAIDSSFRYRAGRYRLFVSRNEAFGSMRVVSMERSKYGK